MAKQVKIGFEKIPVPSVETFEVLYDKNTGIPLKSSDGRTLYTQEKGQVSEFASSSGSLSVHVNNEVGVPIKVLEQYPETSEVSNTLLGIPRAEVQLGLFSDVSIYGVDDNIWEFFTSPTPYQPTEWINRRNPTYGSRYYQQLDEVDNEQALVIKGFPTPWTFPYGPGYADTGRYQPLSFPKYQKFIELGNVLYDYYATRGEEEFARQNFLDKSYAIVIAEENDVFYNDVDYTLADVFAEIEKWTLAWIKLRDGKLVDPAFSKINFPSGYDASNTSPGYSSQTPYYAELQSKRVFRYQPGRASGFSFGVRASTDPGSVQNVIEWGCANDTDEYMFQIKGSQFNIVRRSVIPLPDKNLARMGLKPNEQVLKPAGNPWRAGGLQDSNGDETLPVELWETVISKDKFNGDPLDGNGPSGYIISFEQVTMYKIEFSWYGAIGAKFFAYVPIGNGDARWVLIHTLVIENELGTPCLKDPFFKFRYVLNITDTSSLTFPQYIYKYGASYYIDGGDEGTVTTYSYSSNVTSINPNASRSLIGLSTKSDILNRDGTAIKNRKEVIPTKLTVSSTEAAKIDIIECEGCPGHSHHYAPGLRSGVAGVVGALTINAAGTAATFEPYDETVAFTDYVYESNTLFSKIIGDGLYDAYLYNAGDGRTGIGRRAGNSSINNNVLRSRTYANTNKVKLQNGELKNIKSTVFENVRISKWDHITASSVPLTKNLIKVNFLNPGARDNNGYSFAEFFIGITNDEPSVNIDTGDLEFNGAEIDLTNLLFAEYAQLNADKDVKGNDVRESDIRIGDVFEMDPRLKTPPGADSGRCSNAIFEVSEFSFNATYSDSHPTNGQAGDYLIIETAALSSFDKLIGGELAAVSETTGELAGLGIFFTSDRVTAFQDQGILKYFIPLSGPLSTTDQINIFLKTVTVKGRYVRKSKVFKWNVFPLYVVIGMRDNAAINNITIEEADDIAKFSHSPTWVKSTSSLITVVNSGILEEGIITKNSDSRIRSNIGLYQQGGLSEEGLPPENFISLKRLSSAQVDNQLQQPLRPGRIHSSFYIGANETLEIDLAHIYGQDRYLITPGMFNTKSSFITAKSIDTPGEIQININTKEQ